MFMIFMDFGAWMLRTVRGDLWPLKKALLDSSWLLSSIFIDFLRFSLISQIFMIFMDFGVWMLRTVRGDLWAL